MDRKWVIGIIREGQKSDYWSLLKGQIEEWLAYENGVVNGFRRTGMRGHEDQYLYNRALDRIEYLKRLRGINEAIIYHNETLIDRAKQKVVSGLKSAESFMTGILR